MYWSRSLCRGFTGQLHRMRTGTGGPAVSGWPGTEWITWYAVTVIACVVTVVADLSLAIMLCHRMLCRADPFYPRHPLGAPQPDPDRPTVLTTEMEFPVQFDSESCPFRMQGTPTSTAFLAQPPMLRSPSHRPAVLQRW